MDTNLDATVKFSAKYTQNDQKCAFSTVFFLDGRKMDVTKISGLFPDPHRMFPRNIFSGISKNSGYCTRYFDFYEFNKNISTLKLTYILS